MKKNYGKSKNFQHPKPAQVEKKSLNFGQAIIYISSGIILGLAIAYLFGFSFFSDKNPKTIENDLLVKEAQIPNNNCSSEYVPVCGDDGQTYKNACFANLAKINYKPGKCEIKEEIKKEIEKEIEEKIKEENILNEENKQLNCTKEFVPVCGEDGKNYPNSCVAESQNIKIAHKGECKTKTEEENKTLTQTGTTENTVTLSGSIENFPKEKHHIYENKNLNYGFAMPNYSYYQGFGAIEGARHTMAIGLSENGIADLNSAEIKVLLYTKTPTTTPENSIAITLADESKVYIIPNKSDNPKLQKIIDTVSSSIYKN